MNLENNTRIQRLVNAFLKKKMDAFLVTSNVNIRYLTGFPAEESWLLVCLRKVYYITDARYALAAKEGLDGVVVKKYTKSIYKALAKIAEGQGVWRLGFDERHLTLAQYKMLRKECPKSVRLLGANQQVEQLREVKSSLEIERIKETLEIHRQAHQFLKQVIHLGVTEQEVGFKLEGFMRDHGVTPSFDTIVASGSNSCHPHAKVTDRKIQRQDVVLVDMGIDCRGYKSDLTRMFFLGNIKRRIKEVYDHVCESQRRALAEIRPGRRACDVDAAARRFLVGKKLAKYFTHSLGHGVGLEVHEDPRLSKSSSAILKEGMVITVEPGVYIPYDFGIRVEDMVLVTKTGCEVLSDDID